MSVSSTQVDDRKVAKNPSQGLQLYDVEERSLYTPHCQMGNKNGKCVGRQQKQIQECRNAILLRNIHMTYDENFYKQVA